MWYQILRSKRAKLLVALTIWAPDHHMSDFYFMLVDHLVTNRAPAAVGRGVRDLYVFHDNIIVVPPKYWQAKLEKILETISVVQYHIS